MAADFQVSYDGAVVTGSDVVSWIARDSSKPGRQPGAGARWAEVAEMAEGAIKKKKNSFPEESVE